MRDPTASSAGVDTRRWKVRPPLPLVVARLLPFLAGASVALLARRPCPVGSHAIVSACDEYQFALTRAPCRTAGRSGRRRGARTTAVDRKRDVAAGRHRIPPGGRAGQAGADRIRGVVSARRSAVGGRRRPRRVFDHAESGGDRPESACACVFALRVCGTSPPPPPPVVRDRLSCLRSTGTAYR